MTNNQLYRQVPVSPIMMEPVHSESVLVVISKLEADFD